MCKQITIYWRDIPSAVLVQQRRERAKVQLSHRFQAAIDRAAMRAGKGGSDAYIAQWRRETSVCESTDPLQQIAEHEAAQLEARWSDEALEAIVRQHGAAKPAEPEGRPADLGWEVSEANGTREVMRKLTKSSRGCGFRDSRKKRRQDTL